MKDARTPFDWLSRDPAVVDAFIAAVDEERRLIRLTCPDGLLDL